MKKAILTLTLIAGLLSFSPAPAQAVVGAEPPPEGMMGITAVQEQAPEEKRNNTVYYAAAGLMGIGAAGLVVRKKLT